MSPTGRSSLLRWQYSLSFLQLVAGLYMIGFHAWRINFTRKFTWETDLLLLILQYTFWLVFSIVVVINDLFMLSVDMSRTNTYLGCITTQTTLNTATVALLIYYFVNPTNYILVGYFALPRQNYVFIASGVSVVLMALSSLFRLAIDIWLVVISQTNVSAKELWKTNTRDALPDEASLIPRSYTLSALGEAREHTVRPPKMFRIITAFLARLLFRRVSPVETRIYAFTRNVFSVISMIVLVFRTITALMQAQNQIGTRSTSAGCDRAFPSQNINILVERMTYDSRWGTSTLGDIEININGSYSHPRRGSELFDTSICSTKWTQTLSVESLALNQTRTLELLGCRSIWTDKYPSYTELLSQVDAADIFAYQIEIRPKAGTSGQQTIDSQMPYIWLLNSFELPANLTGFTSDQLEVQSYVPPWQLLRGSHIEAEANLITRRFITSSILRDIVLNSKPTYRPRSLYPIVESSVFALNSSEPAIATATIRTSFTAGLMYLRRQANSQTIDSFSDSVCDYIEDYRSGTILDVAGTVGGLFALLQATHILLFGRSLFWGLAGAKLIMPFGLFGKCSSRGFRRRLREEYHTKSTGDELDTIQVTKFLRDFVIDFGPADLDLERSSNKRLIPSPYFVAKESDTDSNPSTTSLSSTELGSETTLVEQTESQEVERVGRSNACRDSVALAIQN